MQPYDITKTFEENITYGPFFEGKIPKLPKRKATKTFLGHKVNSLFGLAASPMTFTARSIGLFAQLGYDIITYRSVRSMEWHGLGAPNWAYVDASNDLSIDQLNAGLEGRLESFPKQSVSTANSFGIQSFKPDYWLQEYERAKESLSAGQLLILALMITPEGGKDAVEDAADVAELANQTTAKVFEINLACPNSGSSALIYNDIETSLRVCQSVKEKIGNKPLLAKVGYYNNMDALKKFMKLSKGVISGLTSTNTYSAPVKEGPNDFFPGRPIAGISGNAIRHLSMEQARKAVDFKQELNLEDFVIIGLGGVMKPEHIDQYLALGVDAVQAVTGVWADPLLASKYHKTIND